jgi:putative tricarboxylic transport membrane protein
MARSSNDTGGRVSGAPGSGRGSGRRGSILHPVDLVVTLVLLAISGWLYYVTTTFEQVSELFAQDIQPQYFPRLVLFAIIGMSLLLPFEHIFQRRRGENIDSEREIRVKTLPYLTAVLLIVVVFLTDYFGTTLTMVATCLLLPMLWGERRWLLIGCFAILFPAAVTFLFTRVLRIPFEGGAFGLTF